MRPQNACSSYTMLAIMSNSKRHGQRPHAKPDRPMCAKSVPSGLTLCDPMDCSWPGTSVCGIPQAGILVVAVHSVLSDSATPWTAARQASLSFTTSQSLLKLIGGGFFTTSASWEAWWVHDQGSIAITLGLRRYKKKFDPWKRTLIILVI